MLCMVFPLFSLVSSSRQTGFGLGFVMKTSQPRKRKFLFCGRDFDLTAWVRACLFRSLRTCAQHRSIYSPPGKLVWELWSLSRETSVWSEPLWPPRTVAATHTSEQRGRDSMNNMQQRKLNPKTWGLQTAVDLTLREQASSILKWLTLTSDLPVERGKKKNRISLRLLK